MRVRPEVRADVAAALAAGRPVVALESTIVSHGLPALAT
jgi:pseudouridylate synthase